MQINVKQIVENKRSELIGNYKRNLSNQLYPGSFGADGDWLKVRDALELHDEYVKNYVTNALEEIVGKLIEKLD